MKVGAGRHLRRNDFIPGSGTTWWCTTAVPNAGGEMRGVFDEFGVVTAIKIHVRRQIRTDLSVPFARVETALVQHDRHQAGLAFTNVRVVEFQLAVVIRCFVAFLNVLFSDAHDHGTCFVNA